LTTRPLSADHHVARIVIVLPFATVIDEATEFDLFDLAAGIAERPFEMCGIDLTVHTSRAVAGDGVPELAFYCGGRIIRPPHAPTDQDGRPAP